MKFRLTNDQGINIESFYTIKINESLLKNKLGINQNKNDDMFLGDVEDASIKKDAKVDEDTDVKKAKKSISLKPFLCETKPLYDLYEEELKGYLIKTLLGSGSLTGFRPFDYEEAAKNKRYILDFERVLNLNSILSQMFDITREQIIDRRDRVHIEHVIEKIKRNIARKPFVDRAEVIASYYYLKIANAIPVIVSVLFSDILATKNKYNVFSITKQTSKSYDQLDKRVQAYFEEEVSDFFDLSLDEIKGATYYEFQYEDRSGIIKKLKKFLRVVVLDSKSIQSAFVMLNVDQSIDDENCIKEMVSFLNFLSFGERKDFKYYNTLGEYENMISKAIENLTAEDSDIYNHFLYFCSLVSETFLENFAEHIKPINKKAEGLFIPLGKKNYKESREFVALAVVLNKIKK